VEGKNRNWKKRKEGSGKKETNWETNEKMEKKEFVEKQ